MNSGIYRIIAPSGGFYIGSAIDLRGRRASHFHLLRHNKHGNRGLQRACAKYGIENLKFEPIIVCRVEDLIFFEQRAIDGLKPRYNSAPVAGSQLGLKHRRSSIAKISRNRRGKGHHSPEWKAAASARLLGHPFWGLRSFSEEIKRKVSRALKGKSHRDGFEANVTDEQKATIIASYLSGVGQLALAVRWRTSHKVIRRILTAAGVEVHPSGFTIKKAA